jgi:hypothetical protein
LSDDDDCSFAPTEHDQSTTIAKLQQYKTEATVNNEILVSRKII